MSLPSSPTSHPHPPPQLPTHTYHTSLLPRSIPTAALLDSAVGAAHYSGVESVNERRRSVRIAGKASANDGASLARRRSSVLQEPNPSHLTVVDDIKDVREPGDAMHGPLFFFSSFLFFLSNGSTVCIDV